MSVRFLTASEAAGEWGRLARETGAAEFALVSNPNYVYQPFEVFALAPKIMGPLDRLAAAVMDMDGTTTTTEPLCLHSLEFMIRRVTDRMTREQWAGLDHVKDYPYVIGNSTTRHVEYLIDTYGGGLWPEAFLRAFIHAAIWTLALGQDPVRRREAAQTARALGVAAILEEPRCRALLEPGAYDDSTCMKLAAALAPAMLPKLELSSRANIVRGAIDIYYQRYHEILARIAAGEGEAVARDMLGGGRPIEPMPGVPVFMAALKGLLGEELAVFAEPLLEHLERHPRVDRAALPSRDAAAERLGRLGASLERRAAAGDEVKAAVVTSSIFHEANIVMGEVMGLMRREVERDWPISARRKDIILARFDHYNSLYDAIVTASDSSEIRLKPHRDLYSIALHQLGIRREEYANCAGFEDSESGTVAIRAAGVGLCVAVPFADTAGHNLGAASWILHGGLPECLIAHNGFLRD